MLDKLAIFLIILASTKLQAQTFKLEGRISDENHSPLAAATVVVLSQKDSAHAAVGLTDTLGNFRLANLAPGKFWFLCSYLGFDPIQLDLELTGEPRTMFLGEIQMKCDAVLLNAVQITEEATPIIVRNDTMYYHAASFHTRPNAAVLDLLKKLPGIEVKADGTIMAEGKVVENILVDGKPFFNDDKLPTQMLEAEAVETVEVYDQTSKTANFTGVSDGNEEKTINLVLKEERKKGWFGEARAAGGGSGRNDLRHNSSLAASRFSPKYQAGLNGNLNNTGNNNGGFQQAQNLSGTLRKTLGPNAESSQNADFSNARQQAKRKINQQIFLPGEIQTSTEESQNDGQSQNFAARAGFSHLKDTTLLFDFNFSGNLSRSENADENLNKIFGGNGRQILGSKQNSSAKGHNRNLNGSTLFGKRLNKAGRSIILGGDLGFSDDAQDGLIFSENTFFKTSGEVEKVDTVNQSTRQTSRSGNQGFGFSFTEPIGKGRLAQLDYKFSRMAGHADLATFDKNKGNGETKNDSLSNKTKNLTLANDLAASTQINWKKWRITPRITFRSSVLQTEKDGDARSKLHFRRLLPSFNLDKSLGETGGLNFGYMAEQNPPGIQQLQAIPDRSDPLNVRIGNPKLKPEALHNFNLGINQFYPKKEIGFFVASDFNYVSNKIIETISLDSNLVRYFRPQNGRGEWQQGLNASLNFPLKKLHLRVSLSGDARFGRSQALVNEVQNRQTTRVFGQGIDLNFQPAEWVSTGCGVRFGQNLLDYSVASELNQRFFDEIYTAGAYFVLPKKITLNTDFNMSVNKGRAEGFNQKIPIWNLGLSKFFLSGDRLELAFNAYDLLNRNTQIQRTTYLNFVRDEQANVLSRYFMLSLGYRLMAS